MNPARVEERDHQHRADVVDDRERRQKDLEPRRHAASQQSQNPEREGDIRRHRGPPRRRSRTAEVERGIDRGRHDHAAQRGGRRQRRPLKRGQLADPHLALDLEPDEEEEHHHEAVVDQVMERRADREGSDIESDRELPEVVVRRGPGRVRPGQRDRRGEEQHDSSRGRRVGELREGLEDALDEHRLRAIAGRRINGMR